MIEGAQNIRKVSIENTEPVEVVLASSDLYMLKDAYDPSGISQDIFARLNNKADTSGETFTGNIELRGTKFIVDDASGDINGFVAADGEFGLLLAGSDDTLNANRPLTQVGSTILQAADQIGFQFNGAETGNFLKLLEPVVINGRTIFGIGTTPLDVVVYDEEFASNADVVMTTSYQNIIQGTILNNYTQGRSVSEFSFRVENSSNTDRTLSYSVTSNDGIPDEIFTVTVPRRSGGVNGVFVVDGSDTISEGDLNASSTVEIQAKIDGGTGVTVTGSIQATKLNIIENSSISNFINEVVGITSENKLVVVTNQSDLPDPDASGVIELSEPNTTYLFRGNVSISNNTIRVVASGVQFRGLNGNYDGVASTTSGSIITTDQVGLGISNMFVFGVFADTLVDCSGNAVDSICLFDKASFLFGKNKVKAKDMDTVAIDLCLMQNGENGIYVSGNNMSLLFSRTIFDNLSGISIDLNQSKADAIGINLNTGRLDASSSIFLNVDPSGGNINVGGEGTITDNKIDINNGGTPIVGYSPLDLEWYVTGNNNIIVSDRIQPNGWGFWVDDESSSQTFNGTPTKLSINGLSGNTNEDYEPRVIRGVDSLWDVNDDCIKPITVGDSYDLRILLEITNTQSNPTRFNIALDIGSTPNGTGTGGSIIIAEDSRTLRTGTPQTHIISLPIFTLNTFVANGGTIWISSDSGNITVTGRQILIVRTSSGAS